MILWIAIYPAVDSVVQRLNNRGLYRIKIRATEIGHKNEVKARKKR